jgi:putative flippase GtrA
LAMRNISSIRPGAYTQFLKFALIGAVNTALHYVVFLVLLKFVKIDYLIASSIGYCSGVLNSYYMNRRWTFAAATGSSILEFSQFVCINVIALSVNLISLNVLVTSFKIIPELAQVIAIVLSTVCNFVGNKYWTFRSGTKHDSPQRAQRTPSKQ